MKIYLYIISFMFSSMFVFALRFNSTPPSIVDTIHRICRLVHPHNSQYHAIKMCLKYITISMLNIFFFFRDVEWAKNFLLVRESNRCRLETARNGIKLKALYWLKADVYVTSLTVLFYIFLENICVPGKSLQRIYRKLYTSH